MVGVLPKKVLSPSLSLLMPSLSIGDVTGKSTLVNAMVGVLPKKVLSLSLSLFLCHPYLLVTRQVSLLWLTPWSGCCPRRSYPYPYPYPYPYAIPIYW